MDYCTKFIEVSKGYYTSARYQNFGPENSADKQNLKTLHDKVVAAEKYVFPYNLDVGVDVSSIESDISEYLKLPHKITILEFGANFLKPNEEHQCMYLLEESTEEGELGFWLTSLSLCPNRKVWGANAITAFLPYSQASGMLRDRGTVQYYDIFMPYRYKSEELKDYLLSVDDEAEFKSVADVKSNTIEISIDVESSDDFKNSYLQKRLRNITEDFRRVIPALVCFNAKNVNRITLPPSKVANAMRVGKKNKAPLFPYHVLHIFLGGEVLSSKPRDRKLVADKILKKQYKIHAVKGHFKKKKNGLFWWSPFIRNRQMNSWVKLDDYPCYSCESTDVKHRIEVRNGKELDSYKCDSCGKAWCI